MQFSDIKKIGMIQKTEQCN